MNSTNSSTIVIQRSHAKLLALTSVSAVFVAISVWMISGGMVGSRGEGSVSFGWFSAVFFGSSLVVISYRLIFRSRMSLELSPQGFWDKGVLKKEVPWSAISRISVVGTRHVSLLRVHFTEEAIKHLELSLLPRIVSWLHKPFGTYSIDISDTDIDISLLELCTLFRDHLSVYNPNAIDDTK